MNIYTRRRGTQEVAGSKSGGGGQSECSVERPAGAEWRAGENALVLSSSDVLRHDIGPRGGAHRILIAHACRTRASMSRWKLAQLNVARYF